MLLTWNLHKCKCWITYKYSDVGMKRDQLSAGYETYWNKLNLRDKVKIVFCET